MPERVVVGSRGSKLALAQTQKVVDKLRKEGYEVELKIIKTSGDIMKDCPLHEFKGIGAFVRAIDEALARREIDIAVHSLKDVPSQRLEGTVVAAVLERESPCDAFITADGRGPDEMGLGAKIGTSSLRRRAQLIRHRRDFIIENLRGNVDTRLRKLNEGLYDAILLAEAGLIRLGIDREVNYVALPPEEFIPSANQGIIAVATREGEEELVSFMNHQKTWIEASVERKIIRELGIGCAVPAGVYARSANDKIEAFCEILSVDGAIAVRVEERFSIDEQDDVISGIVERLKVMTQGFKD
jgi:hydroxymethylbilane synthase